MTDTASAQQAAQALKAQQEEEKLRQQTLDSLVGAQEVTVAGRPCRIVELPVTKQKLSLATYFIVKERDEPNKQLAKANPNDADSLSTHLRWIKQLVNNAIKRIGDESSDTPYTDAWYDNLPTEDADKIWHYIKFVLLEKKTS